MDSQQLVNNLKADLADLKQRIKTEGIGGVARDSLIRHRDELEALYNKVLAQGGVLTEEQKKELSDRLTSANKAVLEKSAKRDKTAMIIIGVVSVVVLGGIIFYVFKKRK